MSENHVMPGTTELAVSATSPTSMAVMVTAGRCSINGTARGIPFQRVAIAAAHPTLARIDLVYVAQTTDTVQIVTGTPASSPTAPALPSNLNLNIANLSVGADVNRVYGAQINLSTRQHLS